MQIGSRTGLKFMHEQTYALTNIQSQIPKVGSEILVRFTHLQKVIVYLVVHVVDREKPIYLFYE